VYKVKDDEYSVDLQRLEGDLFIFLDVATRLVSDIRA
jgi:5'-AMP-activated protein kinase catalytic alpha subunit